MSLNNRVYPNFWKQKEPSILVEIRETVNTLVKIANGEDIKLTQRQAYLAVRVMDLTEGYIASVDFTKGKWQKYRQSKNI